MFTEKGNEKEKRQKIIQNHLDGKYKDDKKFYDDLKVCDEHLSKKELKMINDENYIVLKDNKIIQKATFDFTEQEMKCLNYTLSKLIPNVDVKVEHRYWDIEYPLRDLLNALRLKDGKANYQDIHDSIFALKEKTKRIRFERDNKIVHKPFNFFIDCEIEKEKKDENIKNYIVKVKFDNNIIPFVSKLKNKFTAPLLIYTLNLNSKYAIRMYELCKSWQEKGEFIFYIDKCRKQWCIPDTYSYGDIKRRVIDKAIDEINKKTDIQIGIKLNDKGKKMVHKTDRKIDWFVMQVKRNENFNTIYQENDKKRKEFLENEKER